MTFTLRHAVAADAGEISRLYAQSWRAAYVGVVSQSYLDALQDYHWTATVTDWLATGRFQALLGCHGQITAGCAIYGRARAETMEGWGELVSLYIKPGYFRKGCGSLVVSALLDELRGQGVTGCYLWVLEGNKRAIAFYERMGFVDSGDRMRSMLGEAEVVDYRYQLLF